MLIRSCHSFFLRLQINFKSHKQEIVSVGYHLSDRHMLTVAKNVLNDSCIAKHNLAIATTYLLLPTTFNES